MRMMTDEQISENYSWLDAGASRSLRLDMLSEVDTAIAMLPNRPENDDYWLVLNRLYEDIECTLDD